MKKIIFITIILWQFFLVATSNAACVDLGQTCAKITDCCNHYVCISGGCSKCHAKSDCYGLGGDCNSSGQCTSGDSEGGIHPSCKTTFDCPTNQICKDSYCTYTKKCTDSKDCASPLFCKNSYCVDIECINDTQCTVAGATCVSGKCVTLSPTTEKSLIDWKASSPTLNISIPGLTFSDIEKSITTDEDKNRYVHIPWIGQYITSIYSFSLAIVSIVAVFMIIIQGIIIITSGGGDKKTEGYKRIGQVVIGLAIMWGSYFILYSINPDLTKFKSLSVQIIEEKNIEVPDEKTPTYSSEAEKPYKEVLSKIASHKKINMEYCLLSAQVSRESSWKPTESTNFAFGLGQISWYNAVAMLASPTELKKFKGIYTDVAGSACPACPTGVKASLTTKTNIDALPKDEKEKLKQEIASWLMSDTTANLIIMAMAKEHDLNGTVSVGPKNSQKKYKINGNPIVSATAHQLGIGAYAKYMEVAPCSLEQFDPNEYYTAVKKDDETKLTELYKKSCVPPDMFSYTSYKSSGKMPYYCPPNDSTKSTDTRSCCQESSDKSSSCVMPQFTKSGRAGKCFDGSKQGSFCYSTASITYMKKYNAFLKQCLNAK